MKKPLPELRRSRAAPLVYALYRMLSGPRRWFVASALFRVLKILESGSCHSATIREILARHHQVKVGAYSYGDCLIPGAFPPQVIVGRWVSIGPGVRVYNQNHPLEHISLHPYFYEPTMGVVKSNPMPRHTLEIGHDAWLGRNATVLPGCKRIGIGAVIGAGAVVTKDVDDYAIVGGNPARLIRYRFPEDKRQAMLASKWWDRDLAEIARFAAEMSRPVDEQMLNHPLLRSAGQETQGRPLVAAKT